MAVWEFTPLGRSAARLGLDPSAVSWSIEPDNSRGLPEVYNARLNASTADILVFVHDDVWIEDFFIVDQLRQGLSIYDVIGVAGNRRRARQQETWAGKGGIENNPDLSGAVAHGLCPFSPVTRYGPAPADCKLLDGVFLAVNRRLVVKRRVFFDPIFSFDYYDLDFCRSAEQAGLRLGTWPISLTHASPGEGYGSESWKANKAEYFKKWRQ